MGLAASRQEAFWEACGFGHLERARHFLQAGDIDVNWVSYTNDCCPIHVASQGKLEIVQLLLEYKCDVNVRDNRGNLPLHHAAMKGHADIVQTLIDAGSDINAQEKNGWTSLHNAAYWCHPQVVNILLNNGCDVNIQNKDERTALHECARSQEREEHKLGDIARTLIEAGSDINSKSSDWGEADLTGLMYAAFHNHPEVANALIEAGCELNAVGTTFWTALHWAADRGNDELVYILLDAGIDPTIRDMRGDTAMHRAKSDAIREFLATAIDIHKELHRVKHPVIRPAKQLSKPVEPFTPKCDANFKSQSFLPKDWKPSSSVDVKNLINEKKSKLAAMTSQKYREDLARWTGTGVIKDEDVHAEEENSRSENSTVGDQDSFHTVRDTGHTESKLFKTENNTLEKGDCIIKTNIDENNQMEPDANGDVGNEITNAGDAKETGEGRYQSRESGNKENEEMESLNHNSETVDVGEKVTEQSGNGDELKGNLMTQLNESENCESEAQEFDSTEGLKDMSIGSDVVLEKRNGNSDLETGNNEDNLT